MLTISGYLTIHGGPFLICSPYQETPLYIAVHGVRVDNPVMYLDDTDAHPDEDGVREREYTADCKPLLLVRVCFHSPNQRPLLLIELLALLCIPCLIERNSQQGS